MANAGHTLPSAIADLVDNAISAGATEISISFPNPNLGGRWLCITDNGRGMNLAELRQAMRIGSRRDYDSKELGKYGYGLKGASWSQANNLTVRSRAEDHPAVHLTWDHDHLKRVGKWEILDLPIPAQYAKETQILETGTAVLLTQMHVPAEPNAVRGVDPYFTELTEVREHLSLVFHRFLEGRARGHTTISISVEGKKLEPNDPVGHPLANKTFSPKNITIEGRTPAESATLMLQAYVLPTAAEIDRHHAAEGPEAVKAAHAKIALGQPLNPMQGFYFYRVDRLIKWGGWCGAFALEEHMKLSRVTVDFNRQADDFLKVNVSKRDVTLGVNLIDQFKVAVKEGRQNARARYDDKLDEYGSPTKTKQRKKPTSPTPTGGGATIPGGSKSISSRPEPRPTPIRTVEEPTAPAWVTKPSFKGPVLEISEVKVPKLAALAAAIKGNVAAETALIEFLTELDAKKIQQYLDAHG